MENTLAPRESKQNLVKNTKKEELLKKFEKMKVDNLTADESKTYIINKKV